MHMKRTSNFSSSEVSFLIATVAKYKHIIECKKFDRVYRIQKARAWKEVEREFNSQFGQLFRSRHNLKTKYENWKKAAKKNMILEQRQMTTDNGGIPAVSNGVATNGADAGATDASADKMDTHFVNMPQPDPLVDRSTYRDVVIKREDSLDIEENKMENIEDANINSSKMDSETDEELESAASFTASRENSASYSKKTAPRNVNGCQQCKCVTDVWAAVASAKLQKTKVEIKYLKKESELKLLKLSLEIKCLQKQLNSQ